MMSHHADEREPHHLGLSTHPFSISSTVAAEQQPNLQGAKQYANVNCELKE